MGPVAFFKLVNTVLEAAIVILIASVLLYDLQASVRSRVAWASNLLLGFTVIAYFGDLLLTQVKTPAEMELWLRIEWIGIAFVPSAYLHLGDALLELSGNRSRWRRFGILAAYGFSAIALALSALTDLIVRGKVINLDAPQLLPGPLFPVFAVLFGAFIALGAALQSRARRRSRTATMRHRINYIIASAGGPVISVFPYMLITGQNTIIPPTLFWIIQIIGNSVVGVTIFFLTYSVAYFGVNEPDRVIRLRLIKFLARGPLVAFGVLIALVIVGRAGRFLGLPAEQATPFIVVGGIVILQWLILLIKPSLERWFYLEDGEEVIRLQNLRDRLLSSRDRRQYLENVLASVCELLQVETAFVASITTGETPQVELIVGDPSFASNKIPLDDWSSFSLDPGTATLTLSPGDHFSWNGFWIFPLFDRQQRSILGILGVHKPLQGEALEVDLATRLGQLTFQAAAVLEDRLLQQEVFAAMASLLEQVELTQKQRRRTGLEQAVGSEPVDQDTLVSRAEFDTLVRDALSHYWGGPKLTRSPLLNLRIVQRGAIEHQGSSTNAMRSVLLEAIESLRPEGKRSMTTAEWILYNILELKFLKRYRVRDIARRLAMSESDLYRKQRIAIEAVARALAEMEQAAQQELTVPQNMAESDDKDQQE